MSNLKWYHDLKKLDYIAYGVSAAVIFLVIFMRNPDKFDLGIDFSFLPPMYSAMNAMVALALISALYFIKSGNIKMHRNMIIIALVLSILFLLSYVVYHATTHETKYCNPNKVMRTIYFILLISHILLAGIILPFILMTFNRGILMNVEKHKKLARWVFPLWLYVAITGPIIYIMLKPCYA